MSNRIRRINVVLPEAFTLECIDRSIPAGNYEVMTEEEPLGDLMEPGYRRIAANIYVPPPTGHIGIGEIIDIGQADLDALLRFKP